MEESEPQMISPLARYGAILFTVLAVGAMVLVLANRDSLNLTFGKGESLDISFTVPGEQRMRSVSEFPGRVVVVTLFRTQDCGTCPDQLQALHELAVKYGREGLVALALSDEDPALIAGDRVLNGMNVIGARMEQIQAEVLPKQRPYTLIFDRKGMLRKRVEGFERAERLESSIEKLLAP